MAQIDEVLDELYAVDLGEFLATRKRFAKELKDSGDREASGVVASAQKPTIAAWVLNQLARRKRKEIDLLLDAGHRLRQAQAGLLRGEGQAAFDAARETERSALATLMNDAQSLLRERGANSQTTIDQVGESLRMAAVADDGRQLLATGRFTRPFTEQTGFDALAAIAPPNVRDARPAQPSAADKSRLREAKASLQSARQRQRRLEKQLANAEERRDRLGSELEKASVRADELRASAGEAAAATADAERKLRMLE